MRTFISESKLHCWMYRVFKAPIFEKTLKKIFDKKDMTSLDKLVQKLKKGDILGKPLSYGFFREKKLGSKRVYYLVYDDIRIVLLVSASNKKYQQETIDEIKCMLPEFKLYA